MKDKMIKYMKEMQLVSEGDRIVVGVSGGADSVCLLYLLNECREFFCYDLFVVHINHKIRGKEADEDEAYVQEICRKLGLHFHAYHMDVTALAKEQGVSLEEAGRKARYDAFSKECELWNCNKVAVAHHMNDLAETVLFHLIRGTGITGLTGIPPKRKLTEKIQVIRPLLCVKREEIEEELKQRQIHYCIDSTNLSLDYSRNKLRNHVLSFIEEELNEGVIEHISNAATQLYEINEYINHNIDARYEQYVTVNEKTGDVRFCCQVQNEDQVIQKGLLRKVLREMLKDGLKDIEARHIEQLQSLLSMEVGKRIHLPRGLIVRKQYDALLFTFQESPNRSENRESIRVPLNINQSGEYDLEEIGKTLRVDVIDYKKNMIIPKNAYTKWFDYDKIKNTVFVRTRQTGDYLQVSQEGGKKKLKDYFIDRKIPREERDSILLLADGNHIMWVLEDRISEAYKVSVNTKKILVINLLEE